MRKLGVVVLLFVLGIIIYLVGADKDGFKPFQPLPEQPPIPEDNPQTPEKIALGRQLFFDPRLSYTGTVNCNSCHNVLAGGEDGRAVSVGALGLAGKRSAPTLWNVAFQTVYNWDGGAASLEDQIKSHITSATEMAMTDEAATISRLAEIPDYVTQFNDVFTTEDGLSYDNLARAIASYIRTLVTTNSPFDQYLRGEKKALSEQALRGYDSFIETGCASCHFWVNLSGPVPGLAFEMGEGFYELFPNNPGTDYETLYRLADDPGRYQVTQQDNHKRMWRVPTLRNIALTAPYFHNGSVKSLDEAVRVMAKTQLGLSLEDEQIDDIVAFLNSLTGAFPDQLVPQRLPELRNKTLLNEVRDV